MAESFRGLGMPSRNDGTTKAGRIVAREVSCAEMKKAACAPTGTQAARLNEEKTGVMGSNSRSRQP